MSELPFAKRPGPTTEDDWLALRFEAGHLFNPSAPIDERDLFAGRASKIQDLLEAVSERGRHAILFGERGVGKTSLANIFYKILQGHTRQVFFIRVQADPSDDFTSIWRKAFREIHVAGEGRDSDQTYAVAEFYENKIVPDDVRRELSNFSPNAIPIIVVDEFDKITDHNSAELFANTIKALSDFSVSATLIVVGVADNVEQLIGKHDSIRRCLTEVQMPRMSNDELKEIIDKRLGRLNMKIEPDALWKIVVLSRGLPSYVHSLGRDAVFAAIDSHRTIVTERHVDAAMAYLLTKSDQASRSDYSKAVFSNQSGNLFEQVLLACALAESNDSGYFSPTAVIEPLSKILERDVEIANFQRHLTEFTSAKRGAVLQRKGEQRKFRFRFKDPMMQPFIIMKGIHSGLITTKARSILSFPEQPRLSNDF